MTTSETETPTCQECSTPLGQRHGWGCDMVLHGEVALDNGQPPIVTEEDCEPDPIDPQILAEVEDTDPKVEIITLQGVEHEQTAYTSTPGPSTMGRSIVYITCGFCGQEVTAYLWSLAGGGKKCPCGAKHTSYGTSTRKKVA